MQKIFEFFSECKDKVTNGRRDVTLKFSQLVDLLTVANITDEDSYGVQIEDVVRMVEKYHDPTQSLESKITDENFQAYLKANPEIEKEYNQQNQPVEKEEKEGEEGQDEAAVEENVEPELG